VDLPIQLQIKTHELISSWVTRLANENALKVVSVLAEIGFENQVQTDFDLHSSEEFLSNLALIGFPQGDLHRLKRSMIKEWGERTGSLSQCMRRWVLSAGHRYPKVRFCPKCINCSAYYRKTWRLNWYAACHRHKVILRDRCHACLSPQVLYRASWRCGVGYCTSCSEPLANDFDVTQFEDTGYWHSVAVALNRLRACTPQKDASRWFRAIWMLTRWLEKLRCEGKTVNLFLSEPLETMRRQFPEAVSFYQARILWDEEPFLLKQLISAYQFEFDRVTYHQCPMSLKPYRRSKDWRVPSIQQLEEGISAIRKRGEDITYFKLAEVVGCSFETIRKYDDLDGLVKSHVGKASLIRLRS